MSCLREASDNHRTKQPSQRQCGRLSGHHVKASLRPVRDIQPSLRRLQPMLCVYFNTVVLTWFNIHLCFASEMRPKEVSLHICKVSSSDGSSRTRAPCPQFHTGSVSPRAPCYCRTSPRRIYDAYYYWIDWPGVHVYSNGLSSAFRVPVLRKPVRCSTLDGPVARNGHRRS